MTYQTSLREARESEDESSLKKMSTYICEECHSFPLYQHEATFNLSILLEHVSEVCLAALIRDVANEEGTSMALFKS